MDGQTVYVLTCVSKYGEEVTRGVFASEHEACVAIRDGSGGNWTRGKLDGVLRTDYDSDGYKLVVRSYVVGQLV